MANIATAAIHGQAELDLGAFQRGTRPLIFLATPNGQYFVANSGAHVFEIRHYASGDQHCWCATVSQLNCPDTIIRLLAPTLDDADDALQAMAIELGGAA